MLPVEITITQSSHMQSVKPAMSQASHMQPAKVKDQYNHKKSQMKQASSTSRKQTGIQLEVARNNDMHAVLPMHDLYVCQQMICQDSASKHWYPEVLDSMCPVYRKLQSHLKHSTLQNMMLHSNQCVSQSTHMWPVKAGFKKLQVNTQSQVETSKCIRDIKL